MSVENPEQYLIPERLDEPYRFMIFTTEESVAMFAPVLIGYSFDFWIQGLFLGFVLFLGLRKLRNGDADFLAFCKYWLFPSTVTGLKYTPSSTIRTFYS